mmetsp:Transcript_12494/g.35090  ORF Transcript_12494/g.35090 Transcript_12494/m.35090 type:complete len:299 (+) Transcript_12494:137-1033(+)
MGIWDFFAPQLCPLVVDHQLSTHATVFDPAVAALQPLTTQLGIPVDGVHRLIAPLFVGFGLIFIVAFIIWGALGITGAERGLFASCTMSMAHGISTTIFAGAAVCRAHPGIQYDMPNTPEHEAILQLSTAYFLADLIFYMVPWISNTDTLFILHHFATSGYMLWSLHIGHGAISSLMLMFLGEITSAFFNPWLAARDYKKSHGGPHLLADIVFEIFTYPYSTVFIAVRGIIAPFVLSSMCMGLATSEALSPATKYTWVFLIVGSYLGSLTWVYKLSVGFAKHLRKRIFGVKKAKPAQD